MVFFSKHGKKSRLVFVCFFQYFHFLEWFSSVWRLSSSLSRFIWGLYCVLEVFSSKSKLIIRFLKSKNINLNFPITFGYQKKTSWQLFYDRFPVIEGDLSLALKTKNKSGRCNIHSLGKKKKNTHASLGFFIKAKRMGLTHVRLTNVRLTIFFCFFFIPFLYLKIDLCAFFLKTNCINFVF